VLNNHESNSLTILIAHKFNDEQHDHATRKIRTAQSGILTSGHKSPNFVVESPAQTVAMVADHRGSQIPDSYVIDRVCQSIARHSNRFLE
jgi:hypothetical protein